MKVEKKIGKININGNEFYYEVSLKKIKNIYLRLKNNLICVSAPKYMKNTNFEKFILDKSAWIEEVFKKQKEEKIDVIKEKLYSDGEFIDVINNSVNKYSNLMKLYPNKITIKPLKYAWGSSSSKKNISFNSELIYKEKEVIDYVVVHELAHLRYMNHQKDFWNLVGIYIPDYKEKRKALKYKNKK